MTPELVVFTGLQASGKSTFYRERLATTHVLVSKDLLRSSRRKEARQRELVAEALGAGRRVVVDNTNPTRAEREPLVAIARALGASATCYAFSTRVADALRRNARRAGREHVPRVGVLATASRLRMPAADEGFHRVLVVRLTHEGFCVRPVDPGEVVEPFGPAVQENGAPVAKQEQEGAAPPPAPGKEHAS